MKCKEVLGFFIYNCELGLKSDSISMSIFPINKILCHVSKKDTQIDRGKEKVGSRKARILQCQTFETPFYSQVVLCKHMIFKATPYIYRTSFE